MISAQLAERDSSFPRQNHFAVRVFDKRDIRLKEITH